MTRLSANLLLILVAVIWGSAFVPQSYGMGHVGPLAFTGIRFLIGALVVLPLVCIERRQLHRAGKSLQANDVVKIGGLGCLLALGAVMQQIGIKSTTVTNAGFLTALYVPLVPLLGWLIFKQVAHWSVWFGALACLLGAYLLSGAQVIAISTGDLWVIASAMPWAVHVLLVGRVAHRMSAPFSIAGGQFAMCGVLGLLAMTLYEPVTWDGLQAGMGSLLYTGVFSVGVAFTMQVVAQRYANAADAAIVLSSETLFAALFGYLLMGDRLNASGIAGCSLIFFSMVGVQLLPLLKGHKKNEPTSPVSPPIQVGLK